MFYSFWSSSYWVYPWSLLCTHLFCASSVSHSWHKASHTDLTRYVQCITASLPHLPPEVVSCNSVNCKHHRMKRIWTFVAHTLLIACLMLPCQAFLKLVLRVIMLPVGLILQLLSTNFWHRVWIEAGWPSAGLLFNIKTNAKKRLKYQVKRLKCHQLYIARPAALASSKVRDF